MLSHFSASSFGGCFWNLFAYCRVVGGLTSKDGTPLINMGSETIVFLFKLPLADV